MCCSLSAGGMLYFDDLELIPNFMRISYIFFFCNMRLCLFNNIFYSCFSLMDVLMDTKRSRTKWCRDKANKYIFEEMRRNAYEENLRISARVQHIGFSKTNCCQGHFDSVFVYRLVLIIYYVQEDIFTTHQLHELISFTHCWCAKVAKPVLAPEPRPRLGVSPTHSPASV